MTPNQQPQTSRKENRERARAERKTMEAEQATAAARRKRLMQLGGIIGAVVIVVAVILITASGGSKTAPAPESPAANTAASEVKSLLQGIPQSANTLGNPSAPVTMQYFGDLECPICKEFTLGALPTLIAKEVRTGKLKIEYRAMQTATREKEIFDSQQVAALAAGKQDRMWYFVELFYHEQGEEGSGYVTESYLQGLAAQIPGLNLSDWSSARNEPAFANQIVSDSQAAIQNHFSGTPSFLIGKTSGTQQKYDYTSLTDPSGFEAAINKALKG